MYAPTPSGNVVALNAATGALRWRFDPNEGRKIIGTLRTRGVAYWSDGKDQRIFAGAHQYLYSLDAQTGKPIATFGKDGRIDLREGLGREPLNWVTMTSPAVVYKDLVIVGGAMSETLPASPGDIRAYDVHLSLIHISFTPSLRDCTVLPVRYPASLRWSSVNASGAVHVAQVFSPQSIERDLVGYAVEVLGKGFIKNLAVGAVTSCLLYTSRCV